MSMTIDAISADVAWLNRCAKLEPSFVLIVMTPPLSIYIVVMAAGFVWLNVLLMLSYWLLEVFAITAKKQPVGRGAWGVSPHPLLFLVV